MVITKNTTLIVCLNCNCYLHYTIGRKIFLWR